MAMLSRFAAILTLVSLTAFIDVSAAQSLWPGLIEGKPEVVRAALQKGADPNQAKQNGRTPLMEALVNDGIKSPDRRIIVAVLLSAGANPNAADKHQELVLSYALRGEDWSLVEDLIEAGADVNRLGAYKVPPEWSPYGNQFLPDLSLLMWCARGCESARFRTLLGAGGDVTAINARGEDAFSYMVAGKRVDNMLTAINHLQSRTDKATLGQYLDERQHLIAAVRSGSPALVRALINAGASINVRNDRGEAPLAISLIELGQAPRGQRHDQRAIVQALLSAGADPNPLNGAPAAPLNLAVAAGDRASVEMLLARGADAKSDIEPAPLLLLALGVRAPPRELHAIAHMLVKHGAALDGQGWNGSNLLSVAAANSPHFVPFFIKAGLDVNHRDKSGNTPLMFAAHMGKLATPIVPDLLSAGADVNAQNQFGWTALIFAAERGAHEVVELLLSAGADTSLVDVKGLTALDIAKQTQFARYQDKQPTIAALEKAAVEH